MRYSVKAAARATGVSESALRTWERRYGIPRPARSASGHRLYEDADLNLIRRMAALIEAGIPASEAAAAVLTSPDLEPPAAPVEEDPMAGRVVAAALSLNESLVVSLLRESAETMGWAGALERVHFGSLRGIGEMWRENRVPSVTEHFLTEIVRSEIYRAIDGSDSAVGERTVVLACPQDERHDVGLLALSLLLRQRGVRTCYLGSDVPPDDLITILRNPSVAAVCIAATLVSSEIGIGIVGCQPPPG